MAEISPELAARIDELRSKHEENPAKFFMSLANAYREAGQVQDAEALLREHLKRHPGYLSAHVLLGGCLADRGARDEARNEFHYVLSIDPQNLIALRTLGDMAAADGHIDEARRWYGEWLGVDPMSGEAKRAMEALEASVERPADEGWDPYGHGDVAEGAAAPTDQAQAGAPAAEAGSDHADFSGIDFPDSSAPAAPASSEPATLAEVDEPIDMAAWGEVTPSDAPADTSAVGTEVSHQEHGADFGTLDFAPAEETTPAEEAAPAAADQPSEWNDWSAASGIELPPMGDTPAVAAPTTGSLGPLDLDVPDLPEPTASAEAPAEPAQPVGAIPDHLLGDDEGTHLVSEPEVHTETMAELLYDQGHLDRAADVYRELLLRRGGDAALSRRLGQIEAEMRGEGAAPAAEPAAESWDGRQGAPQVESITESWDGRDGGPAAAEESPPAWLEAVDAVAQGFSEGLKSPDAADATPEPAAEPMEAEAAGEQSAGTGADGVGAYLSALLGWRPGAEAAPAAEPAPAGEPGQAEAWPAAELEDPEVVGPPEDESTFEFADGAVATAPSAPAQSDEPAAELEVDPWTAAEVEAAPASGEAATPAAESAPEEALPAPWEESTPAAESAPEEEAAPAPWEESASTAAEPTAEPATAPWEDTTSTAAEPAAEEPAPWEVPAAPAEDAPPAALPWDEQTLNAPEQQPPLDEPWMAPETTSVEPSAEDTRDPFADSFAQGFGGDAEAPVAEAAEPAAAETPETPEAPAPWDAGESAAPWEGAAAAPEAEPTPAAEAPGTDAMPWEAEGPPAAEAPATPAAGGFSFEDFFTEPPAAAPTAPTPAASAPAAAVPAPQAPPEPTGDEDEDLESFQAWLQSLKR